MLTAFNCHFYLPWRGAYRHTALIAIALLFPLPACSSVPTTVQKTLAPISTETTAESGLASFYNDKYHNQKTASGERYQHELYTAAHRTLAFGSRVKVTSKETGESVLVTINDRGPFIRGRVIDLSKAAFSAIGDTSSGLIHVDIQVVE